MPTEDTIEVFFKLDNLKLKEPIEEIYIYQDNIKEEYSFFYNDEIKFPVNLEKTFWKRYGKVKKYFDIINDIKAEYSKKEQLVKVTYKLKHKYAR
jgi:hypothetical protein